MSFQPLFTASRVVVATYRILSTTVLLYYLVRRLKESNTIPDRRSPKRYSTFD